MGTGPTLGQGFLGKASEQWANKALASLNQEFGRGTFKEGNRTANIEYVGGKAFLAVENAAIKGKPVNTDTQYIPLVREGNGTFRLESNAERNGMQP